MSRKSYDVKFFQDVWNTVLKAATAPPAVARALAQAINHGPRYDEAWSNAKMVLSILATHGGAVDSTCSMLQLKLDNPATIMVKHVILKTGCYKTVDDGQCVHYKLALLYLICHRDSLEYVDWATYGNKGGL